MYQNLSLKLCRTTKVEVASNNPPENHLTTQKPKTQISSTTETVRTAETTSTSLTSILYQNQPGKTTSVLQKDSTTESNGFKTVSNSVPYDSSDLKSTTFLAQDETTSKSLSETTLSKTYTKTSVHSEETTKTIITTTTRTTSTTSTTSTKSTDSQYSITANPLPANESASYVSKSEYR
jgi:hypothetical protein